MSGLSGETLRRLVEEAVRAVLAERGFIVAGGGSAAAPSHAGGACSGAVGVCVLLTAGRGDLGAIETAMRGLSLQYALDVLCTSEFQERYGDWRPTGLSEVGGRVTFHEGLCLREAFETLDRARALVVPLLSRPVGAKTALAIADDVGSAVLFRALSRGTVVVAMKSSLDPDAIEAPPAMRHGPNSLRHLLETYVQRLTAWGVRWCGADMLSETVAAALGNAAVLSAASPPPSGGATTAAGPAATPARSARRFITREDLWALLERGEKSLAVGPTDIVTLEARDFAAAQGLSLEPHEP